VNRISLLREQDGGQARIKSHSKRGKEADWALAFDTTTGQQRTGEIRPTERQQ
jgi:hypothetical protein